MKEDKLFKLTELALFKFSLIAPVVNDTYEAPSKMEYFRQLAAMKHVLPNGRTVQFAASTIKKWYINYTRRRHRCTYTKNKM